MAAARLGVVQLVAWGVLYYGFGVLLPLMTDDLHTSAALLSGAFSLALAISGAAAIAVGLWLDQHDPRQLMAAGSILGMALVVLWSTADSLFELYAVFAGLGIVMAMTLYEPAAALVVRWFGVRAGAKV